MKHFKIDLHDLQQEEAMKVMMKQLHFLVMTFLLVILLSGCSVSEQTAAQDRTESEHYIRILEEDMKTIYLAGGCFW